jgi:hypothetical protein
MGGTSLARFRRKPEGRMSLSVVSMANAPVSPAPLRLARMAVNADIDMREVDLLGN